MDYLTYYIDEQFNNLKIIDFFNFYKLSKTKVSKLSKIILNDKVVTKNHTLSKGDILKIEVCEEIDFKPLNKKIDIEYEDDYLLILNKPKGMIVHPDDKSKNNTLVNMVANYFLENNIKRNVRYIHRLDTDTTGLIIFAKDMITASYLNYLLSIHSVKRCYMAIVCGVLDKGGVVDANIGEDRHHNQRRRVSKTGQVAVTNYEVIKRVLNKYTLVKLQLQTGRTHQIRVHMKYLGHPLAGDMLYEGSTKHIKRVALHSYNLVFIHPFTNKKIELTCKIPQDMEMLINAK